jgi:anti-anti-sigma factor
VPVHHLHPAAAGSVALVLEDGGAVLHLRGEIDAASVAAFDDDPDVDRSYVGRVAAIDATEVTFFSSMGVRLLLQMTEDTRAAGVRPLIRRPTRPLLRILDVLGLADRFTLDPSAGL